MHIIMHKLQEFYQMEEQMCYGERREVCMDKEEVHMEEKGVHLEEEKTEGGGGGGQYQNDAELATLLGRPSLRYPMKQLNLQIQIQIQNVL